MGDERMRGVEEGRGDGAALDIWDCVFGFTKMAVVKCAIELGVADAIENHGSPMSLSELSAALGCEPSRLQRIMRFLVFNQIFTELEEPIGVGYAHTPSSRCLIKHEGNSMAALILLESSPVMLAPWQGLRSRVLESGNSPFQEAHGKDLWCYAGMNPDHSKLFDEAMAGIAGVVVPAIIEGCSEVFDGVGSLVDVAGGNGNALSILVKAFPWIRGINFDLPHVVDAATKLDGIEYVGGDMFECVPKADTTFIMNALHNWDDEECIRILKKCREAIPKDKGKVIIVEVVLLEEEKAADKRDFVRLMLDMVMMAHTNKGKERTLNEWSFVLGAAGFTRFNIKPIHAVPSVIEAYP